MQKVGLDPTLKISPRWPTEAYTKFLSSVSSENFKIGLGPDAITIVVEKTTVPAYTLAVITPCMRLYAFLGKEILPLVGPDEVDHPYKMWIDNYSSEVFEVC